MAKYVLMAILCMMGTRATAQKKKEVRSVISYISASVVYVDAGREQRILVGDTLAIVRGDKTLGAVTVTAVSNRSCAVLVLTQQSAFAIGDAAVIEKVVEAGAPAVMTTAAIPVSDPKSVVSVAAKPEPQLPATGSRQPSTINIVSGRLGIQYAGVHGDDARFDLRQPSALFRLDVANMFGTGMAFSVYSRNYYDLSPNYNRYGESSRMKNRIYELSIQRDLSEGTFGFGIGRMTSRFVSGLGTFDGGQAYVRFSNFTAGVVAGAKIGERTMAVDGEDTKGAAFVNFRSGEDFLHQYEGTVAYGRQLSRNKLDREFLYIQNSWTLGSKLSMYESTEIELNDIHNGVRTPTFSLSNTFFSINYYANNWFSANAGYDATRSVYLFESMKAFPDTLFDKNLLQGYRGGVYFRFPYFVSLSLNGTVRTKKGDERTSHNVGATVRMSDIGGSDVGAGIRYTNILSVYTEGNSITFDLDRTLFNKLSLSMRYDYYAYTITALNRSFITHTTTANVNYRISRALYSIISVDRVIDDSMNSYRIYGEIGIRF